MSSCVASHTDSSDSANPALAVSMSQGDMTLVIRPQEASQVSGHGHALTVIVPRNHTLTIAHGHDAHSGNQEVTIMASAQTASAHPEDTDGPIPRSAVDADTPLSPSCKRITDSDMGVGLSMSTASGHGNREGVDTSSPSSSVRSPMRPTRQSTRVSRQSSLLSAASDDIDGPRTSSPSQNNSNSPFVLPHGGWVTSMFEELHVDEDHRADAEDDA